ncbi:hypothetical protein CP061683_1581, partial [Chlamydia psittaci 06-1683]
MPALALTYLALPGPPCLDLSCLVWTCLVLL